jgi:hypothetical protein
MTDVQLEPVVRSVDVGVEPAVAFRRFTEEMAAWWPLGTHSVGGESAEAVRVEPREGGGIIESTRAGEEHRWGTITWWDPPLRLAFTWHPGRDPATAQEIEVTFEPQDGGGTRVLLVHGGWSRFGPGATETHAGYGPGWEVVLGLYAAG